VSKRPVDRVKKKMLLLEPEWRGTLDLHHNKRTFERCLPRSLAALLMVAVLPSRMKTRSQPLDEVTATLQGGYSVSANRAMAMLVSPHVLCSAIQTGQERMII
jgi:hypothetical protein